MNVYVLSKKTSVGLVVLGSLVVLHGFVSGRLQFSIFALNLFVFALILRCLSDVGARLERIEGGQQRQETTTGEPQSNQQPQRL